MKKLVFIWVMSALALFSNTVLGQEIIVQEDFELYTVDQKLVEQAANLGNTNWQVWGVAPGGPADPLVKSVEGTKAVYVEVGQDPVLLTNGELYKDGAFSVEWDFYVETGKLGYFNVLKKYDGANSVWGTQLYLFENGTGTLDAGKASVTTFSYTQGAWNQFKVDIDLDNDWATVYVNGTMIVEWEWSKGCFGDYEEPTLAAMNFYGIAGSELEPAHPGVPTGFYIDNIACTQISDPLPPPVVSIMPDDEIKIDLQPNSIKDASFFIINEEEGTLKATWSTYVDYSPVETGTGADFLLALCDPYEVPNGGIGSSGGFNREIAMRLSPADYVDQLGGELKQIGFFILDDNIVGDPEEDQYFRPGSDLTFRVYAQGPTENTEGELLAEKVLSMADFVYTDWNFVEIDPPVQLTGGDYWVAVAMYQEGGSYPLTHTTNPLKYGGDWSRIDGGKWSKISDGNPDIKFNWAIQATGDGSSQKVWGLLDKTYGTTASPAQSEIKVTVNSETYDEGIYTAKIIVITDDPLNPRIELPLIMAVSDTVKSNNTNVKELTVNGEVVPPNDDPGSQYDYMVQIETDKDIVDIVVTPEHELATVTGQKGEQPLKSGMNTYRFTVTAEDETEREYVLLVGATIIVSISEVDNTTIKLFPNPVSDNLYITSEYTVEQITIYDLTGKMVKQVNQPGTSVNLSDLSAGYYMLKVTTEQGDAMHKFVKE